MDKMAGLKPTEEMLTNIEELKAQYFKADSFPIENVAFGTSGHRGSSFL